MANMRPRLRHSDGRRLTPGHWITAAAGLAVAAAAVRGFRKRYDFERRVVVITGGSRGLGLVLARRFAAEGARLALLARDPAELARAQRELTDGGATVLALRCDVRSQIDVAAAITHVVHLLGRVDVLVNNAGTIQMGPMEHMLLDDFHDAMAVHLWGPLYAILAALPHMRGQGSGRIVNIASIGGKISVPHLVPYCTSKFALVGLSEGLRHELKRHGILVTTVCPGLMRTGSTLQAQFKGDREREYEWFAILGSLPGSSMKAERAARQIVEACRRGDAEVILSLPARAAVLAHSIAPGLVSAAFDWVAQRLPAATGGEGDAPAPGWQSRGRTPAPLTLLSDRAARRNNEVPREFQRQGRTS
jgi:NAD(P)-dependent dehydrogenase (short-subunit alcohol dehydrogenase family)